MLYNGLLFLLCDVSPIILQLSTLIFGYIRQKEEKKQLLRDSGKDETLQYLHQD